MSDNNAGKKWWTKPIWKLPLWAWIVIVIVIISAIGSSGSSQNETSSSGNSSDTTEQNQSDTTIRETEETTAPSKPEMTPSQENAVAFSRQGLIDQLSSEYGSEFPLADAKFAVTFIENNSEVDWNAQAAKSAKEYLDTQSFSCNGLIDQLSSEYGSKFTKSQATYGATQAGLC